MQASVPSKPRLPITPAILQRIRAEWNNKKEWDHIMLWAAMCLCFFGFLRAGKAVAPDTNFDTSQNLTYADIAVDNLPDSKQLQVNIKQSKTDPVRLGVKVWIGRAGVISVQWQQFSPIRLCEVQGRSIISLSEWQSSNEAEAGYQDAGGSAESRHRL